MKCNYNVSNASVDGIIFNLSFLGNMKVVLGYAHNGMVTLARMNEDIRDDTLCVCVCVLGLLPGVLGMTVVVCISIYHHCC